MTAVEKPVLVAPGRRVPWTWWLAAVLSVGVAAYSLRYVFVGEAAYVPELAPSFRLRRMTVVAHTLFGPIALVFGLVNLLPAMRQRRRWTAHRWIGRTYLVSALILGGAGLSLAFYATGGTIARTGFALLAVLTIATAVQGYRFIKARNVRQHREWMLRCYALIFGAVMLRVWLPLLIIAYQGQFLPAYRWVAWVSWVPNLIFIEYWIRRGWRPVAVVPESFADAH
jgi:uncharacterized membrane protein